MANTGRKRAVEILDRSEVASLIRQCSTVAPTGIRNRALITVMYAGGLRLEEALDLKPADISAPKGTIRILHGKGDRARTVAIDDGSMAMVQRWLDVRPRVSVLFCTLPGGQMSDQYVRALMKRLAAKAGITKRVHAHALRHTNAAEMQAEGVPVNVIRKHLGHKSLATTQVYLDHISPADVIAAGRSRHLNLES